MTVMEEVLVEEYMRALRIERLVKVKSRSAQRAVFKKRKSKEKSIPICNTAAETL